MSKTSSVLFAAMDMRIDAWTVRDLVSANPHLLELYTSIYGVSKCINQLVNNKKVVRVGARKENAARCITYRYLGSNDYLPPEPDQPVLREEIGNGITRVRFGNGRKEPRNSFSQCKAWLGFTSSLSSAYGGA